MTALRQVLNDETLDAQLRRDGFAVIPLLEASEVERLRRAYWEHPPEETRGMVVDYMFRDRAAMHRTRALAEPLFRLHGPEHFADQRLVLATFAVKHPGGSESAFFLHDDRSYVDESRFRTTTVWIPLVDVGPGRDNGGLQVVPRSHHLPTGLAGSLTPDLIRPYERSLRSQLVQPSVRAGEALVYDTRVLHASPENRSDQARVALALALAPKEADLLHVVATGRRHRRVHAIDETFFLDHHVRDVEASVDPHYPVVEEYDDHHELTPTEVADVLGGPVPEKLVVLPGDLNEHTDPASLHPPPTHVLSVQPAATDLAIMAGHLAGSGEPIVTMSVSGGAAASHQGVRRALRSTHGGPIGSVIERAPIPRSAVDADVVILDPGARVTLELEAGRRWVHHLTVADCPPTGSGLRSGGCAMNLAPSTRVDLPPGASVTLWNEGPGPLAAVVSRSPAALLTTIDGARRLPETLSAAVDRIGAGGDRPWGRPAAARTRAGVARVSTQVRDAAPRRAGQALMAVMRLDERLVNAVEPPVDAALDPTVPPWASTIQEHWADIRKEFDQLTDAGIRLPETNDIVGVDQHAQGRWTTYVMGWYGRWAEQNCERCPTTAALLHSIPGLQVAGFTVLGPQTRIPKHQGPTKSYRWQLGIRIPGRVGDCGLRIGDDPVLWREGEILAFDDRTPHEAWNDSDEERVVLFIQVPWPISGWRGVVHRSIQAAFGRASKRIIEQAERLDGELNPPA